MEGVSTYDRWCALLKQTGFSFSTNSNKDFIFMNITYESVSLRAEIQIKNDIQRVYLSIRMETMCPEPFRINMVELINALNFLINCGFFAMDPSDGQMIFRQGIFLEDADYNTDFISIFLKSYAAIVSKYYEPIRSVAGGMSTQYALMAYSLTVKT